MIAFRKLQRDDLAFLVSVRNECRAMLHDDREFTLAQAEDWFDSTRPRFYLVALAGSPIGYFRTSNWSETNRHVYVGCDLHADFRGKGYGLTAYRMFLRFLFEECEMNKISLEALEHNQRALRLYRRLGFVLEGIKRQDVRREDRYLDSLLFSMLKSEFVAQEATGGERAWHPS